MDNFYSTLQPHLRIFQFFGFAPYSIERISSSSTKIRQTWQLNLQSLFMLIIIFLHFGYMLYLLIYLIKFETASSIVISSWMIGLLIINALIFIEAWLMSGRQIKLIYHFAKLDELIRNDLKIRPNYSNLLRQRIRQFSRQLCIAMCGLPLFWSIWFFMPMARIYIKHMLIPPIFMSMRLLQILYFLNLLMENLQLINQQLLDIEKQSNVEWKLILFSKNYQDDDDGNNEEFLKKRSVDDIKILRKIYGQLWKTTLGFNDHFGGSILLLLLYYLLDIFTVVYFIFVILVGIYKQSMFLCFLTVPSFVNTMLLTQSSVQCMQMANNIKIQLCRLRNENHQHTEIKLFSLQTLHEPIIIHANHFFNVTYEIIASFVSGIAAFMLLYCQFEIREKFGD